MVLQPNTSFGGTQALGEHFGVSCDECKAAIRGIRHKCNFCPNYDLCSDCRQRGVHNHHMMHELHPYPPHHQPNFPQPPTPYPQYPHPTSPPNQYNNPPYQYPQSPGQYPQTPGQYPYPHTYNSPNPSYPSYPSYPGQTPSQGGQTPLPLSNPMPTQYPFSPSPYPHPNSSSTFTTHTYQPYPSQYPHDQTSSPIQAPSNTQQPPCIESVTAAQLTQAINSNPIPVAVSTPPSTTSAQNTQITTQAQSYHAGATTHGPTVAQGQTTGLGAFDGRPPPPHRSMRGFKGGFPAHGCHGRRHPPSTQMSPIGSTGQLLSSVLDQSGLQNLMQSMVLSRNASVISNPSNQVPPVTGYHPTPAAPAPGGSDNLSTSRWSPAQQGIPSRRIPLHSSDEEHQKVIQRMKDTGGDSHVAKVLLISRIENYTLFNIFKSCKEEMERENGTGFQNERILWHGTSADVLDNIYRGGFNRSYCGKNATAFGKGVYFATSFSYSASNTYSPPDAKGQKYVFQCRVLTGHFAKGQSNLNEPPMRTAELRYDTVVDNVSSPNMYVVFKDMQVYPEYVITLRA